LQTAVNLFTKGKPASTTDLNEGFYGRKENFIWAESPYGSVLRASKRGSEANTGKKHSYQTWLVTSYRLGLCWRGAVTS